MMVRTCQLIFALNVLSGCAIGIQHDYGSVTPSFKASGTSAVAVAVQDQRAAVVSGKREENWVGVSRGGYNNPFKVSTLSKKPLAQDFASVMARSLTARGFSVSTLEVSPSTAPNEVLSRLVATGKARLVVITLRQWECDVALATHLDYEIEAKIYNESGAQQASNAITYHGAVGGALESRALVPQWYRLALESLLNSEAMVKAMTP